MEKSIKKMEPVHFRLPGELMHKIREISKKERRNISQTIRIILEDSIHSKNKQ